MLDEELHRRLRTRFENELMLWSADDASHLMAIATFGLTLTGLAVIEEMALMVVSENWIPYDSIYEKTLIDSLAKLNARSVKSLRYSLLAEQPSAAAMLQRQPRPLALYIVPPTVDRYYEEALEELIASRPDVDAWTWRVTDGEMPPFAKR
jgi:hypothetical protein